MTQIWVFYSKRGQLTPLVCVLIRDQLSVLIKHYKLLNECKPQYIAVKNILYSPFRHWISSPRSPRHPLSSLMRQAGNPQTPELDSLHIHENEYNYIIAINNIFRPCSIFLILRFIRRRKKQAEKTKSPNLCKITQRRMTQIWLF